MPGFTAPKLLWVRKNEPHVYRDIARICLPKDYVRLRLTGQHAIDVSESELKQRLAAILAALREGKRGRPTPPRDPEKERLRVEVETLREQVRVQTSTRKKSATLKHSACTPESTPCHVKLLR